MPKIRSETSKKSKWWISKHRFLSLYHFCLEYREWKDAYDSLDGKRAVVYDGMPHGTTTGDPTSQIAMERAYLSGLMELVESTARETDAQLSNYIFRAVTDENITYPYLCEVMGMPCSRNTFYDRRRRFYWLLDKNMNGLQKIIKIGTQEQK